MAGGYPFDHLGRALSDIDELCEWAHVDLEYDSEFWRFTVNAPDGCSITVVDRLLEDTVRAVLSATQHWRQPKDG
jgi:hypothetical protein